MEIFSLHNPTKIHFGKDSIQKLGDELKQTGKKALILMGKGSVKKYGIYDQLIQVLDTSGIEYVVYEGIKSNPIYQHADEAVALAKQHKVDMLIALGGGSVIDSAKAVAMGYYHDGSVWDFYMGKVKPQQALPLFTILTLAATGTEMNAATVIQDTETGMKKGFGNPLLYPKVSILDPTYTFSVNKAYTAYGISDLIAHCLEVYFSKGENKLSSLYIASILRLAIETAPKVLENPEDYEARALTMWLATNALNGTLGVGRGGGDWGVHGFEHSLSVLYDIPHGAGLSIVYPAWLKHFKSQNVERISFLGREVFQIPSTESLENQANGFIHQL
jgi:alcohol dehydrogenase YqhD (iron-dependent ADH family)